MVWGLRLQALNAGPKFRPWSGNWIPHAATKEPHAVNKGPTTKWESHSPTARSGAENKQRNKNKHEKKASQHLNQN